MRVGFCVSTEKREDVMMKKLLLGAAAGALLFSSHAFADEGDQGGDQGEKAEKGAKMDAFDAAKCDGDASSQKALGDLKAIADSLKGSPYYGKAEGHFRNAQNHLRMVAGDIRKACLAGKKEASKPAKGEKAAKGKKGKKGDNQ
jgi:hypothetical protein